MDLNHLPVGRLHQQTATGWIMPKSRVRFLAGYVSMAVMAIATEASAQHLKQTEETLTAWEANRAVNDSDVVTTGVARGRDRLDSATSTSAIKENQIDGLGSRSLADLYRNIPGIRVEASAGETSNSYTVRGLPLVNRGAKYIQLQEDGLPVLELGDFNAITPDTFLRADLNVSQIESIRGGSASTFASNAPGGVINLISKTGEVEGGSVQLSSGLNYRSSRADFDYGGHLGNVWRLHLGGFFRQGEGPRRTGYDAVEGGQLKVNVTREFAGGYIRAYGKVLNDRTPYYYNAPVRVTGTNDNPKYKDLPSFSINRDTLLSRYNRSQTAMDVDGNRVTNDLHDGVRAKAKSFGLETQFTLADWTITERFRFSDMSGGLHSTFANVVIPATTYAETFGLINPTYANGPRAGTAIDPVTLNGNGLLSLTVNSDQDMHSLRNVTNDLRVSRVWNVGGGDLTSTAGVYKALQTFDISVSNVSVFQDVRGDGKAAYANLTLSDGFPITQDGVLNYGVSGQGRSARYNVDYDITAPYGSFNFRTGRIAIGGSVRYDFNRVSGVSGKDVDTREVDLNGDGVISNVEQRVAYIAPGAIKPIDYHHGYLSYSTGINYRVAKSFSIFTRYSRGGRAAGDAIQLTDAINRTTGALVDKNSGNDTVRQAESGIKFRRDGIAVALTGFYAWTRETNSQVVVDDIGLSSVALVKRRYKTYGAEFEGSVRRGPFSINGSATVTDGEISAAENPELVGNKPRHQAALIYTLTPQYDVERFTLGANVIGQTSSFAQDINALKMPGYTTVGLFVQYRPVDRLALSVNASNIFDAKAFTDIFDGSIPASGITTGRTLYGRLVSASARFFF